VDRQEDTQKTSMKKGLLVAARAVSFSDPFAIRNSQFSYFFFVTASCYKPPYAVSLCHLLFLISVTWNGSKENIYCWQEFRKLCMYISRSGYNPFVCFFVWVNIPHVSFQRASYHRWVGCSNYDSNFSDPSSGVLDNLNSGRMWGNTCRFNILFIYRTYCVNPQLIFARNSTVTAQ
jgi:hypothetical protein